MKLHRFLFGLLLLVMPLGPAYPHALEPAYLDIRQLTPESWQVFWRKPDVKGAPMAIRVELPDGCDPSSEPKVDFDGSAWIASWISVCPDGMSGGEITIEGLAMQRTDVLVRLQALSGAATTARLTPQEASFLVPVDPTTFEVLNSYFVMGFEHILEGWDHLLFVFALLILIRDAWRLVGAITAFTVAHSITLALAALGHVSVPGPPVEAVIALSITFLAVETLKQRDGQERLSVRSPWLVAFGFGLLHGLGFAGALREIGLPEGDIAAALLAFNLGVEAGQLTFVSFVLAGAGLLRYAVPRVMVHWQRPDSGAKTATAYAIGCVSTFWLVERLMSF